MATPSKKGPSNFGSLTSSIIEGTTRPTQQAEAAVQPKDRVTSFELKGELRTPLDRVVHGLGKKGSLKSVLNAALAYYIENDPKAKKLAATPTPDEAE